MKTLIELFHHFSFFGVYEYFKFLGLTRSLIFSFAILTLLIVIWLQISEWKRQWRAAKRKKILLELAQGLPEECRLLKKGEKDELVPIRDLTGEEEKLLVPLEDLTPIWKKKSKKSKGKQTKKSTEPEEIKFKTKRVNKFIQAISKFNSKHLHVCIKILELLEEKGDYPSVIPWDIPDTATNYDRSTHQKLEKISLLDHSLNVAEQVMRILTLQKRDHLIPDAVVAALGHDLGKLPLKLFLVHHMEDHALPSAEMINNIPGFFRLAKNAEILEAIKLHHKDSENFLDRVLRGADQEARQMEIKQAGQLNQEDSVPEAEAENNGGPQQQEKRSGIDIGGWFDVEAFLQEIKSRINVVEDGRFQTFSMPDGVIYVEVETISDILMQQAGKANISEIVMRDKNNVSELKPVLLALINLLRAKDLIEANELKIDHYMTFFDLHYRGEVLERNYTPFKASAFLGLDETIEQLEQLKEGPLLDIKEVVVRSGKK
jgi:HD domain